MVRQRLQQALAIRQLSAGLTGLTFGVLLSVFESWITSAATWLLPLVAVIFIISLIITVWLWLHQTYEIRLNVEAPKKLIGEHDKKDAARKGLIAAVSLFTPQDGHAFKNMKPAEWQPLALKAAQEKDYAKLDFEHSNISPTLEAIKTHSSKLKHCWLIGTVSTDPEKPGSALYIPAIIEYFKNDNALKECQFHPQEQERKDGAFDIIIDDDSAIFDRTRHVMQDIFIEANKCSIQPKEIIADFTSGFRSISLGIILSCLDRDHDIQMIGAHYDATGRPKSSESFPIIFTFEPILQPKN